MSFNTPLHKHPRVLYLGMRGQFSIPPLLALLEAGIAVCGVVVPGETSVPAIERVQAAPTQSLLPLINPFVERSIVQIAWERNIPVFAAGNLRAAETIATLAALHPDVGCVACFNRRVPPALLALPRRGFLNIHPSLLPAYRGPAPLFWTFRDGVQHTGVTLHLMDQTFDTGPIVAQAPVTISDGISGPEADRLLALHGGRLLVEVLQAARHSALPQRSQPSAGSVAPWPSDDDFHLDPRWSAQRAFNFMRGTAEWQRRYTLPVDGSHIVLQSALAYTPNATLDAPYVREHGTIFVQFTPGVLHAQP